MPSSYTSRRPATTLPSGLRQHAANKQGRLAEGGNKSTKPFNSQFQYISSWSEQEYKETKNHVDPGVDSRKDANTIHNSRYCGSNKCSHNDDSNDCPGDRAGNNISICQTAGSICNKEDCRAHACCHSADKCEETDTVNSRRQFICQSVTESRKKHGTDGIFFVCIIIKKCKEDRRHSIDTHRCNCPFQKKYLS